MTAAAELYRTLVLDHGKHPRNVGCLAEATHVAEGDNPLCGDAVRVEAVVEGERIVAVRFSGESCLLATASASLMTERTAGACRADVGRAVAVLDACCARGVVADEAPAELAEILAAFVDVHRHAVRVGCALLPWRTLARALGI
jgi:nitrogen fixation NifU-like protein